MQTDTEQWVSGVILAAGSSTRLGRPKQLLTLDDKILLQHVVDAATEAGLDEVVVVLGHQADAIESALVLPPAARVVLNPDHPSGQSTSLRVGLDALDPRSQAAAILLGDQPRLHADTIRRALDAFRASSAPVVRCVWRGTPGHPVFLTRDVWDRVSQVSGDTGARGIIAASDDVEEIEMGEGTIADVDTWEQYIALGGDASERRVTGDTD